MFRKYLVSAVLAFFMIATTPAFAKWTGWVNLGSRKELNALNNKIEGENGQRLVPKKVKCKAENNTFYMNVDHRAVFTGGIFYLDAGYWKNLEAKHKTLRRRGANVLSRSDIETSKGLFTCIIWHKPEW